jgi:hypothetical protein
MTGVEYHIVGTPSSYFYKKPPHPSSKKKGWLGVVDHKK